MNARDRRRQIATVEYHSQRQLAQEVRCPDCKARIDRPCRNRAGDVMAMEHASRIKKAEWFRSEGLSECSFCQLQRLPVAERESAPEPAELIWCGWHRRVYWEIHEAQELAQRMDAAQWDGHWRRFYQQQLGRGRAPGVARARATEMTNDLFGPRPEETEERA